MKELNDVDLDSLKKAIELQKKDCDKEALQMLKKLFESNPNNFKVIGMLGLVLSKTKQCEEAISHLQKAVNLKPNWELTSLSLYNNYVELENYEMAFKTLFRYLENNSANMFKDTLEELLEGLVDGYGTNFKNQIIFYAKENSITIPESLL